MAWPVTDQMTKENDMVNDEATVARLLPEPPNGTRLVVQEAADEFKVIVRDDSVASAGFPEERWYDDSDRDPMEFYQHVKYATAVYPVGTPLARFVNGDE